ncbi:MAG: hypothetical protein LLF28_07545 [Nitrospiraceae bacterium]|nr:hypothetical protein [Nitrospiraceae bacterium]
MKIPNISLTKITACLLLFVFCLVIVSCGKKTPPTLKAYEKPVPPENVKAVHREDTIVLTWSYPKKSNLKEFYILKSDRIDFDTIANLSKDETSYIDKDFKTGNTYRYKIVAQTVKEVLSNDSETIEIKPLEPAPAPRNISFFIGNSTIEITWENTGKEIIYNVYKSYEKGKYGFYPLNTSPLDSPSFAAAPEFNRTVYYTVRSSFGKPVRDESMASVEIEVSPSDYIPSKPAGIKTVKADEKVILTWKENPEPWVTKYRVYRKIHNEGFKVISEPVTPVFVDREKAGNKQLYKITAVGPVKESEPSQIITVDF